MPSKGEGWFSLPGPKLFERPGSESSLDLPQFLQPLVSGWVLELDLESIRLLVRGSVLGLPEKASGAV